MMGTEMLPILAECKVIHQFTKQKSKLNFSSKTDGEFISFLLETTLSMLSVVKQISPVIKAVEEVALICDKTEELDTAAELKPDEGENTDPPTTDLQVEKPDKKLVEKVTDENCQLLLSEFSEEMNDLIENLSNPEAKAFTQSNDNQKECNMVTKETVPTTESNSSETTSDPVDLVQPDEKSTTNQAECGVCGKAVGKGYLKEHLRLHLQNKWQCDYCHKTFSLRNYLVKHMKRFHGDKRFQCNLCQRSFASTIDLEKHMPIHKVSNPFICEICQKGFAHYSSLKRHLIAHTGVKNFHCSKCDKYFMRKDSLNNHKVLSCTGKSETSPSATSPGASSQMSHSELNDLLNTLNSNNVNLEGLGGEILDAISKAVR
ncbi:zinc finger protein 271-like isoform X2 [Bolinopsis microptera]|uniref:zinc finger protein 271-like isoform X2 n=1 Tax=Bolinopsis microptera TaxID=2820187 RepID=UPI00307A3556